MSPSEKGDLVYLLNILECIGKINEYTKNINSAEELNSIEKAVNYDASMMQLVNIGEYISKLTEKLKDDNVFISWKQIKGLRNRVVHDYAGVNIDVVYRIMKQDLLLLKSDIEKIITTKIIDKVVNPEIFSRCKGCSHYRYIDFNKFIKEV